MSQHMQSEEINRSRSYQGYEEAPSFTNDARQKLSVDRSLKVGYRWALTISSIILWNIFFFIVILGESVANVTDSQSARLLQPLLILGLVLFTVFLVTINILVHRQRQR